MRCCLYPFLLLVLQFGVTSPKRGGSSGTGSRGGGSSGGGTAGGGSRPAGGSSGGWSGGAAGRPVGGGGGSVGGRPIGGGTGSFAGSSGGKSGFLSSPTSRGIAAGLAGGAIAGIGTAMLVNHLSSSGRYQAPNGNSYYYGDRYYPNQPPAGKIVCRYEIQANDTHLNNIWVDNTTKVKEIIFECRLNVERCCNGLECCPLSNYGNSGIRQQPKSGISWWGGLLIALLFVSAFGCIGCCIYNRVKKTANATGPDATYVATYAEPDPNQFQYPAQPQPFAYPYQAGYPQQSGYPAQPQTYPAQQTVGYGQQQPPAYPGHPIHTYGAQAQPYDQKYPMP